MNLNREEIERIAIHHLNEIYPELPALSGRAEDFEDIIFLARDDNFVFVNYVAALYESILEIEQGLLPDAMMIASEVDDDELLSGADPEEDLQTEEQSLSDADAINFLRQVIESCRTYLFEAQSLFENNELQDAYYRIGFAAACVQSFNAFADEDIERGSCRAVATAWAYLPYIPCVFEYAASVDDEDRLFHDAVFILGLVHGSLWFSNTDFLLEELAAVLEKIPAVQ